MAEIRDRNELYLLTVFLIIVFRVKVASLAAGEELFVMMLMMMLSKAYLRRKYFSLVKML